MADITAEANNFREFFTAIDADGDGWINQTTDLSTLLAKVGAPEPPARAHLASCVSNPHYINFDEFCGLLSKCSSGPSEAEIVQEMFTSMDTAFSGFIGVAEVRSMFQRAGGFIAPATEAELDAMIREADLDGDGRLSLEEFKHVVEQCS